MNDRWKKANDQRLSEWRTDKKEAWMNDQRKSEWMTDTKKFEQTIDQRKSEWRTDKKKARIKGSRDEWRREKKSAKKRSTQSKKIWMKDRWKKFRLMIKGIVWMTVRIRKTKKVLNTQSFLNEWMTDRESQWWAEKISGRCLSSDYELFDKQRMSAPKCALVLDKFCWIIVFLIQLILLVYW